jgi:hypothetical protein
MLVFWNKSMMMVLYSRRHSPYIFIRIQVSLFKLMVKRELLFENNFPFERWNYCLIRQSYQRPSSHGIYEHITCMVKFVSRVG